MAEEGENGMLNEFVFVGIKHRALFPCRVV